MGMTLKYAKSVQRMLALYLHIPFCAQVCHYCDFAVLRAPHRMHHEFIQLLAKELALRAPQGLADVQTAYLGGGTPSVLAPHELRELLSLLHHQGLGALQEFSMEFNPDQVHSDLIEVALQGGVNRYSMGLQSLDDSMLSFLGRTHTADQGLKAWDLLAQSGFRTGSVDLMFNLPGQSLNRFLEDVKRVLERSPQHVSFYGLSVERNTLLGQKVSKGQWVVEEELYAPMYQGAIAILSATGLHRYEVSNCAIPGHESLHNQVYWQRKPYLGVGPGAHSFLQGVRLSGPRHYAQWREWVLAGCPHSGLECDPLDRNAQMMECIWLSLRCESGLDLQAFAHEFGGSLPPQAWEPYVQKGWLVYESGRLRLMGEGWLFMDSVVSSLQARAEQGFFGG